MTRVVYFGTPEVAVGPLRALVEAGHEVGLVVTRPPKRRSRRAEPTQSPVAEAAAELGLAVTVDPHDAVAADADVSVVVAYGEHISDKVLAARRTVNLHFSLLPRWRGAAPVERAILAGDAETGVCLMDVASEIDTGDVYRMVSVPIDEDETADALRARLCEVGIELLLDALANGFGESRPQSGEMTWADKITPADLRIDWNGKAEQALRVVRVGAAWTTLRGKRLKVLEASRREGAANPVLSPDADATRVGTEVGTGGLPGRPQARAAPGTVGRDGSLVLAAAADGFVELVTVQSEGRRPVAAQDWLNGARLEPGERLGE